MGSEGAQLWLVTELFTNGSLEDHIYIPNRSPHVNLQLVTQIAMDIARGMTLLHTKQIVHRDLKAGNILVTL
jgi:serine/threonine protein kinase